MFAIGVYDKGLLVQLIPDRNQSTRFISRALTFNSHSDARAEIRRRMDDSPAESVISYRILAEDGD